MPSHRPYLLAAALSLTMISPWAAAAAAPEPGARCGTFTVAMIPDTQNYLDYRHQTAAGFAFDASALFDEQMRYVASNARSAGGDIVFMTHVGDVWQHYSAWMDPGHEARGFKWSPNGLSSPVAEGPRPETRAIEIPSARKGFSIVEGKLPISVVPGNHDYDALWTDPRNPPDPAVEGPERVGDRHVGGLEGWLSVFSDQSALFRDRSWYVASNDGGADSAQIFTAGQCRLLHIGLQFDPPDSSLRWANEVIRRHPGLPTIVTTHKYLDPAGKRAVASGPRNADIDPEDNDPETVWNEFISQNDQIFLVLSGHIGGQGYSVDRNRHGHDVHQILADYQGRHQANATLGDPASQTDIGDGWLRLLTFELDGEKPSMSVRTYSTLYGRFSSELPQYAAWYKKQDRQEQLSDAEYLARDDFTVELGDFHERFASDAWRAGTDEVPHK